MTQSRSFKNNVHALADKADVTYTEMLHRVQYVRQTEGMTNRFARTFPTPPAPLPSGRELTVEDVLKAQRSRFHPNLTSTEEAERDLRSWEVKMDIWENIILPELNIPTDSPLIEGFGIPVGRTELGQANLGIGRHKASHTLILGENTAKRERVFDSILNQAVASGEYDSVTVFTEREITVPGVTTHANYKDAMNAGRELTDSILTTPRGEQHPEPPRRLVCVDGVTAFPYDALARLAQKGLFRGGQIVLAVEENRLPQVPELRCYDTRIYLSPANLTTTGTSEVLFTPNLTKVLQDDELAFIQGSGQYRRGDRWSDYSSGEVIRLL